MAFENFDFSGYDLVISNKSGFCHGVVTDAQTVHICYCLTPTRYVWRTRQYADQESLPGTVRWLLPPIISWLRVWDRVAADRVDHFVAISQEVRRRIGQIYRRDSTIIYPPVDTTRFQPMSQISDYFLFVGRLVPYRRIDILIEAFNQLGLPLMIAGSGRDRERLESLAEANITFLGYVPDGDLPDLIGHCRAFIFPGEEDFGIAPIQAMAAGRPVIAYAAGGALDTVLPGKTGLLFSQQTGQSIKEAVARFETLSFDSQAICRHAAQFDAEVFRRRISSYVDQHVSHN